MTTTTLPIPTRSKAADLIELVKPRMNMLVLGTTMVGFHMAANWPSDEIRLPGALVGTALCAAGAAVLNQVIERRRDAEMVRTRNRPIPGLRIQTSEALGYGLGLAIAGLSVLQFLVNPITAMLAALTIFSYVLIYTPLKPRTSWNTLVGAFPGALPPLMGWTAARGHIDLGGIALLWILFVWQIPHFMAIAILYRKDYAAAGFKMLPVVDNAKLAATGRHINVFSVATLAASIVPFLIGMAGAVYLLAAIVLGLAYIFVGLKCARDASRPNARRLFLYSIIYLPVLLTILMFDRL